MVDVKRTMTEMKNALMDLSGDWTDQGKISELKHTSLKTSSPWKAKKIGNEKNGIFKNCGTITKVVVYRE
jgi:hypothetical protein